MRISIFGLFGVILAVLSLVLPWVSVTNIMSLHSSDSPTTAIFDYNYAPLYIDVRMDEFQNFSLISSHIEQYWSWNAAYTFSFFIGQHLLHLAGLVMGVFSLLVIAGRLFVSDGMIESRKKARLIPALLWAGSIISHFCSMSWFANSVYGVEMLTRNVLQMPGFMVTGLAYLNLGLYVAALGGILLFVSWFNPVAVFVSTTGLVVRFQNIKRLRQQKIMV